MKKSLRTSGRVYVNANFCLWQLIFSQKIKTCLIQVNIIKKNMMIMFKNLLEIEWLCLRLIRFTKKNSCACDWLRICNTITKMQHAITIRFFFSKNNQKSILELVTCTTRWNCTKKKMNISKKYIHMMLMYTEIIKYQTKCLPNLSIYCLITITMSSK